MVDRHGEEEGGRTRSQPTCLLNTPEHLRGSQMQKGRSAGSIPQSPLQMLQSSAPLPPSGGSRTGAHPTRVHRNE